MTVVKILAVDDEPLILQSYLKILTSGAKDSTVRSLDALAKELLDGKPSKPSSSPWERTFAVTTVQQGEEALQAVSEAVAMGNPFAVVFIDMRMPPGIDGLETAKRMLMVDGNLEIVIVTAYSDRTRTELAEALGEARFLYIQKPFHPDELLQTAQSLSARWELAREQERLDRDKEIFARNMSHELRHPLQVVLGICDTLLSCEMEEAQRQQFIRDIHSEAQRLAELVEKLRMINQLDSEPSLEMQAVELKELTERVVRLLKPEAKKKHLQLTCEAPEDIPLVRGDESSLMQILINLVVNAIHYTETGSVCIRLTPKEHRVLVEVQDTGVGVAASEQKAIFRKFYRVPKQALKVRGHGLGLSIVQDLLQGHGSTIAVESNLGQGSCFFFDLFIA